MKKSTRILLAIVLCVVLVAISLPGKLSFNNYKYDDASRYNAGGGEISQQVEKIDVNWVSGKVNIALHDGDEIILSETASSKLKTAEEVHWLVDGDTLYVKFQRAGRLFSSMQDKELTLLVPEDMKLDKIVVSSVSAEVEAELPEADAVQIDSVSGEAEVTLRKTETVRANTVSGDMTLRFATEPDSIDADSVSGDVTVQLPENAGFTAKLDSVSGKVGGELMDGSGDGKTCIRGNGECSISMDSVSGDLRLDAFTR